MLPSSLLSVYKRKGQIQPRYAKLSSENLAVAGRLIEAYRGHIGEKKQVLTAFTVDLENQGYEHRFVRALSLLLDRRCSFSCNSKFNPPDLRRKIFQATEKNGLATTPEKRRQILQVVAGQTALTEGDIEEQLYADLESELILNRFDAPSPLELLQQYNLCLAQTLLFDCIELSFKASGNWQTLFYSVKKLGLIYEVQRDSDLWVKIDGPVSLFKLTKRYGINIAKLLPLIVANLEWTINAKILWKYTNEICNYNMDNTRQSQLLPKPSVQQETYDSAAEETFAKQFKGLESGWTLKREPEPVVAGTQVIVPDFSLERGSLKVFLEIVGFWTEEYLLRKAEKLKQVDVDMILAVNEDLACEKLVALESRPQLHFIYYRDKIPLSPIIRYLEAAFEEVKTREIKLLENLPVKFTESIVNFDEFAQRIGVSTEAVQTVLATNPPLEYMATSKSLVSKEKLQQIQDQLDKALKHAEKGKLTLDQATLLIESEGLSDASAILSYLGYKITWHGISSQQAEVSLQKRAISNE